MHVAAVGDTATSYDPAGHLLIVVEGNFQEDVPTPTQVEILAQMVAWASLRFDVPLSTITGHRLSRRCALWVDPRWVPGCASCSHC